ncbi:MAG TPA: 3-oxoadipate enol-lactonase [Nocardioidaceae bacterium]|nr:3-oxoadipate enol-lactonase [Nocardioidaceae bacterium]
MTAVDVSYDVSGRADGPVVLLSNSLGSTMAMWDGNVAALESQFRVVRYDTRGHGESPVPDGPYEIDDLVDDLIALLDTVGADRAHLVGLSIGGMTAMRLAIREPERVDRLVLICTSARLEPVSGWLERAALVRDNGTAAIAPVVAARWFTPTYLDAHPELRVASEAMVAGTPPEGYAGCCEAIAAMDLRDDLASIKAPTLAIAGADDPAIPLDHLRRIADSVHDARLLVVADAAHLAAAQQPDTINAAMVAHLEDR